MYGQVSTEHIMDNIAQLDQLMAVNDDNKLSVQRQLANLTKSCTDAAKAIEAKIMDDKKAMIDKMEARALQVKKEYAFLDEPSVQAILDEQQADDGEFWSIQTERFYYFFPL